MLKSGPISPSPICMLNEYCAAITLTPIAHITSCYPDRFGIPRQAGLVVSAYADIVFPATEDNKLALRNIQDFSHLWVIFLFHKQKYDRARPLIRPPRLGGNKGVGVYASRSPNRPNPIGLSAVELVDVTYKKNKLLLHVMGGDFLDRTPVLDIKPYVPYADAIATARSAWATPQAALLPVRWSAVATATLIDAVKPEQLKALIEETLAQDPRPGYERNKDGKPYQQWNMQVREYSVFWKVEDGIAEVTTLELNH